MNPLTWADDVGQCGLMRMLRCFFGMHKDSTSPPDLTQPQTQPNPHRVTGRGHMDVNRISGYLPGKIVFFLMQVGNGCQVWAGGWGTGKGWAGGWSAQRHTF